MTTKLTTLAAELKTQYPSHSRTISAGLALALLGKVRIPENDQYTFGYLVGKYEVHVSTKLGGWRCTCPQGQQFGPELKEGFLAQGCPHFCKHIAAAGLIWQTDEQPEQPQNLLCAFRLMTEAGEFPASKEQLPLSKSVKIVRLDRDGRDTLALKTGYTVSKALAHWGQVWTGQLTEEAWIFEGDIEARYQEWVNQVKK